MSNSRDNLSNNMTVTDDPLWKKIRELRKGSSYGTKKKSILFFGTQTTQESSHLVMMENNTRCFQPHAIPVSF